MAVPTGTERILAQYGTYPFEFTTTELAQFSQGGLFKCLAADDTGGQTIATVQPWFPTAGAVRVAPSLTYMMDGILLMTTGATTHTTALGFGGTATLTSIDWIAQGFSAAAGTTATAQNGVWNTVVTSTVLTATSTATGTAIRVSGIVRTNRAGTFIPQFTFSANPTGTITIKKDTYFRLVPIGSNTVTTAGYWI